MNMTISVTWQPLLTKAPTPKGQQRQQRKAQIGIHSRPKRPPRSQSQGQIHAFLANVLPEDKSCVYLRRGKLRRMPWNGGGRMGNQKEQRRA